MANNASGIQGAPTETKSECEIALEQVRAANEELQRRKADAENDRELFRDLYNKASAHASDVTKENNELSERVAVAEGQVRDGLAMVRGTYETQVRLLEEEVAKWKGLSEVLMEKDRRTDSDAIRQRAALGSELQAENQRLRAELAELRMENGKMERMLDLLRDQGLSEQEEVAEQTLWQMADSSRPPGVGKDVQAPISAADKLHQQVEQLADQNLERQEDNAKQRLWQLLE